jgi:hypothetical protein
MASCCSCCGHVTKILMECIKKNRSLQETHARQKYAVSYMGSTGDTQQWQINVKI